MSVPRIPPPAPGEPLPPPPPGGWISDLMYLTADELDEIQRLIGEDAAQIMWCAHAAVAYARRVDPQLYPWDVAGRLTLVDIAMLDADAVGLRATRNAVAGEGDGPDPTSGGPPPG